jgi:hypothetical protein
MCSECYTGWLTHWGEAGANTSSSASHVASILAPPLNGSVSLYMGRAELAPQTLSSGPIHQYQLQP